MSRLKRTLLAALLCFAMYVGLVCRIQTMILNQHHYGHSFSNIQQLELNPSLLTDNHRGYAFTKRHIQTDNHRGDVFTKRQIQTDNHRGDVFAKLQIQHDSSSSLQDEPQEVPHKIENKKSSLHKETNENTDSKPTFYTHSNGNTDREQLPYGDKSNEVNMLQQQHEDEEIENWDIWKTDLTSDYEDGNNNYFDTELDKNDNNDYYNDEDDLTKTSSNNLPFERKFSSSKERSNSVFLSVQNRVQLHKQPQRKVNFTQVGNLYVYGAYLDLRLEGNFSVRLLSTKSRLNLMQTLVCYVQDRQKELKLYAQAYKMCEDHGKLFEAWMFSCVLPPKMENLPTKVKVASVGDGEIFTKSSATTFELRVIPAPSNRNDRVRYNTEIRTAKQSTGRTSDLTKTGAMNSVDNSGADDTLATYKDTKASTKQNTPPYTTQQKDTPATDKDTIGVCVPPLFGDLSLSTIINFIQMCKVLGADQVFMYAGNVSSEIRKFLEFQAESDQALSIVEWTLPGNLTTNDDAVWYHGQVLAVQDCLYHNMADFSWLLFMDLDEMLIPQQAFTWPDMINQMFADHQPPSVQGNRPPTDHRNHNTVVSVDKDTKLDVTKKHMTASIPNAILKSGDRTNRHTTAALSFRSVFFDPTRVPEHSESMQYFQHLHRTKAVSQVRNKLLVQPIKVLELGIHHLSKALSEDFQSVDVGENVALLHHYRVCVTDYEPHMKCYPTKKDKTILRYKNQLMFLSHKVSNEASRLFA